MNGPNHLDFTSEDPKIKFETPIDQSKMRDIVIRLDRIKELSPSRSEIEFNVYPRGCQIVGHLKICSYNQDFESQVVGTDVTNIFNIIEEDIYKKIETWKHGRKIN